MQATCDKWTCAWNRVASCLRQEAGVIMHRDTKYPVYETAGQILKAVIPSITDGLGNTLITQLYGEKRYSTY